MAREFYIVPEDCIACGTCHAICPDCFRFEEGVSEVAEVISFDCPEALVQEAMDACPGVCIFWKG